MKRKNCNQYHSNTKDYKRILWTIICQQIGQPRRNGQISSNKQPFKIESEKKDADDTTLMAESEEKLNSLLMKVKEESEKV